MEDKETTSSVEAEASDEEGLGQEPMPPMEPGDCKDRLQDHLLSFAVSDFSFWHTN